MAGFEYRSAQTFRGIPIIHVAFGHWERRPLPGGTGRRNHRHW